MGECSFYMRSTEAGEMILISKMITMVEEESSIEILPRYIQNYSEIIMNETSW